MPEVHHIPGAPRGKHVARLICHLLLAIVALLPSCAPRQQVARPSPGERGPSVGVEVCVMVVDDDPFDDSLSVGEAPRALPQHTEPLAQVLSPYANRVIPVTPAVRALWRANGLRLISVPRKDFDYLKDKLRLVGPIQQQAYAEAPTWISLASSPRWSQTQSVVLDDGPLSLGPGSLRMMMRCWLAPASLLANEQIAADPARRLESGAVAGAIQLEMCPQHEQAPAPSDLATLLQRGGASAPSGVMLSRFLLEASFTTDDMLLVVPERPDIDWRPRQPSDAASDKPLGPPVPAPPTLGDLLLTDLAAGAHRNTRTIIVISPSPPRKFNLLAKQ